MAAKLIEWEKVIFASVKGEAFGNYLFHQFSQTLNQLDGAVRMRGGVVLLSRLGDNYN